MFLNCLLRNIMDARIYRSIRETLNGLESAKKSFSFIMVLICNYAALKSH